MSNIVTIGGIELPDGEAPNTEVVAALEELLDMARQGLIVGFVATAHRGDGIWRVYEEGPFDIEPTVGHMQRQIYRLLMISEEHDAPGR